LGIAIFFPSFMIVQTMDAGFVSCHAHIIPFCVTFDNRKPRHILVIKKSCCGQSNIMQEKL